VPFSRVMEGFLQEYDEICNRPHRIYEQYIFNFVNDTLSNIELLCYGSNIIIVKIKWICSRIQLVPQQERLKELNKIYCYCGNEK
jgi:hypothetical protein